MNKSGSTRKLSEVLDRLVDQMGIRGELREAEIVEHWAALAGPEVNAYTDSVWLRGRRLFVKITSAARRQQLHLNRSDWRRRLNQTLGDDLIDEIVFR